MASSSFAQETPTPIRTKTIGSDPLILLFGAFGATFGIMLNDGKNELEFSSLYISEDDEETISFLYGWLSYRMYKNGGGRGLFYVAGIGAGSVSWDYESNDGLSETVDKVVFFPTANIGYRWNWNSGLTLAPYIGASYQVGKLEASDGGTPWDEGNGEGFQPSFGINLGYMF